MSDAFSFAASRLFTNPDMISAATLWPGAAGGMESWETLDEIDALDLGDPDEAISLNVVRRTPDQMVDVLGHGMVVATVVFLIRVSEAPALKVDDVIQIGTTYYTLTSSPTRDSLGLTWRAPAREGTRESHSDAV
ncbi:MAG: hypothetical protein P1U37_06605 [Minwuia sp.]|nr:hypothetical protein [Minwuia sp.]